MARAQVIVLGFFLIVSCTYLIHQEYVGGLQAFRRSQDSFITDLDNCSPHRLAVIIPFRNAFDELMELVPSLHEFLVKQCVNHKFYVINQADIFRFNKGSLVNIGYLLSRDECDYLAIHDVDLLPLNSQLQYSFPEKGPFHVASPEYHPFLSGKTYIGGIILLTMKQFEKVRGMTNTDWGWGGEDNEFYMRILNQNMTIYRKSGLSTGKDNTFKNLHNPIKRPRDKKRFNKEHKDVFQMETNTGFHDVEYNISSTVEMTIKNVPITVYNVNLGCDINVEKWCSFDT
uniref:beta-1,4-galactosyltransferase 7-like n=1 Tax=Styela clava TaxID=7725 RepID=UPI00193A01C4|nr:beta-1,4-galactosyltransferase 7-like [Styela clava]